MTHAGLIIYRQCGQTLSGLGIYALACGNLREVNSVGLRGQNSGFMGCYLTLPLFMIPL
jgi:hypothetical protein